MDSDKKITVKFLVDKKHGRVVFAESDKDFVDILLSFLTMPMGTICRLLNKDFSLGCLTNLYNSIANLDNQYLQTEACKSMLLCPLNSAAEHCENLVVNIDDWGLRKFFICRKEACRSNWTYHYSSVSNLLCRCGEQMNYCRSWPIKVFNKTGDGVFVKGGSKFIITDNLQIIPASTGVVLSLLGKFGKNDGTALAEKVLDLSHEEILKLLQSSLSSNSPMTNLCFDSSTTTDKLEASHMNDFAPLLPQSESKSESECKEIKVKLLLTKEENNVVHMEGGKDMADLLFSFLTLPLGSVIKLLNKTSSMGCVDNIYRSVESLCSHEIDSIKSEECKIMLLHPKLAPFFSCESQLLKIDEMVPIERDPIDPFRGYYFKEVNPKCPKNGSEPGGEYAKGPGKFVITDDLHVSPLSPISIVSKFNKLEVSVDDLVEKEIKIREAEALNLLKAAVVSKKALSGVFSPNNIKTGRF